MANIISHVENILLVHVLIADFNLNEHELYFQKLTFDKGYLLKVK